jgi:hypothetical protein
MRIGFEHTLSDVVSRALGATVRIFDQGRTNDGRFRFGSSKKSQCSHCTVAFLKEHAQSDFDHPCNGKSERRYCDALARAQALATFGSARAVEIEIEAALRAIRIPTEVSLGRGSAHNLSITIKVTEADKVVFQTAKRRTRSEQRLSSTLGAALNVLTATPAVGTITAVAGDFGTESKG